MGRLNLAKLQTRVLSALVMAPVFAGVVFWGGLPFLLVLLFAAGVALWEWFSLSRRTSLMMPWLVGGVFYVGISFYSFYMLRVEFSFALTLLFVCMVWSSDIGAYFAGKLIGGPKMVEAISPNKTWAGMAGATLSPALIMAVWGMFSGFSPVLLFVLGFVVGVLGQAGDLLVSLFKRQAGAKDSGALIPGHGGLLDRIDAMMLCAPAFLLMTQFFLMG